MLKIQLNQGAISNLNPRIEAHGDELKQAVDITVSCQVAGHSKGILEALRVPELFEPLWDSEGIPQLLEADIRLRHKIHNCEVILTNAAGQNQVTIENADLKGIRIEPLPAVGLELRFKVQAEINGKTFGKLWDLQLDAKIKISVAERQGSLDVAA